VRACVQRLLTAWHSSLLQQVGAAPQGTPLVRQQHFGAKAWDSQLRKLLPQAVRQVSRGWGSAPSWGLRQGLRAQQQQHAQPQSQQQQQQQAPGLQLAAAAPAAAARRSARLQAQGTRQQAAEQGSASSDDEGTTGSSSASFADSDATSSSGGSSRSGSGDSASSDRTGPGTDADEAWAELTARLASLDDLLLPAQQTCEVGPAVVGSSGGPAGVGAGANQQGTTWRPTANSLWRPVGPGQSAGAAAGGAAGSQADGAAGGLSGTGAGSSRARNRRTAATQEGHVSGQPSWACLPAGMQLALLQAAGAGVAPEVLQRTFARLMEIVGDPQSHGNQA
jgi:hypothetical protein